MSREGKQLNILLTGASGFIGQYLLKQLRGENVRTLGRTAVEGSPSHFVIDMAKMPNYENCLKGIEVIVHTAARAHIMKDEVADPLSEYRHVNVDSTLNLARQAAAAGVKRFIFISSIKVNGEQTPLNQPFTADDTPSPEDAYGISKYEAEKGLQKLAAETGLEVVIIRPPLVYGPRVKGNFASMIKLVVKGLPLPLGAIRNQRSLVAIDNLVDLIIVCIDHPAAVNEVFLAGDGQDLSTTELLRSVARALDKPSRLFPVPVFFLMLGATVIGKKAVAQRVLGSLQVDISKASHLLGWEPTISVEQGLLRCFQSHDK